MNHSWKGHVLDGFWWSIIRVKERIDDQVAWQGEVQHQTCKGIYTEHQKKLIISVEWHSLKSNTLKWLIIGHRLAIWYSLPSTSQKTNVCLSQKGVTCSKIARGNFSKITETARFSGTEFSIDKSQYGGYITRHWMFWIGAILSEQCDFWKITFCHFTIFFSLLIKVHF